jgi:hypothetical protein
MVLQNAHGGPASGHGWMPARYTMVAVLASVVHDADTMMHSFEPRNA